MYWIARQSSKLSDEVRFLDRALLENIRPWSVTDLHATLRRSKTRFDSWQGHWFDVTLEPDGTATGCNPVQVGSTPTGVLCEAFLKQDAAPPSGARRPVLARGGWRCAFRGRVLACDGVTKVSSMVEHQTLNLAVMGSTPIPQPRAKARSSKTRRWRTHCLGRRPT